jgi:hypothetical protein
MVDNINDKVEVPLDNEQEEFFTKEDEISDNFNLVQKAWMEYEDCQVKVPYEEAVMILKRIEYSIIHLGMFSPNEELKELPTENLKYLLVPFYLADILGKLMTDRRRNLALSKKYYDEFVKLCNHYELVTKEQRKQWKTIYDNAEYEPSREDKIQSFKEKKELDYQIKNLEKIKDEQSQREILTLNIKMKIMKAIEDIRMANMAIQMEDYRDKMEKEKQQNPDKKEEKFKPKPMKVWQIPGADKNPEQPYFMSNEHHGCQKCDPMYNLKHKQDLKETVFQPFYSQPEMTLDAFADLAMNEMAEQERQQKIGQEMAAAESLRDPDRDEVVDAQNLKDRNWDDWKDAHEKGAGNKKR